MSWFKLNGYVCDVTMKLGGETVEIVRVSGSNLNDFALNALMAGFKFAREHENLAVKTVNRKKL